MVARQKPPHNSTYKRIRLDARGRPSTLKIAAIGHKSSPHEDLYHSVLGLGWVRLFTGFALIFLCINALFASIYLLEPAAIANARPGSFEDAFFFSVQTIATIGYGAMSPATRFAHTIVALEALTGILGVALITGITFSKFARPTARVLFSEKMVIAPRNGIPHLMFRMANFRHNQVLEAELKAILLVTETSIEGHTLRRPQELKLVRHTTPFFALSWTAMHVIDETSPFFGKDGPKRLHDQGAELLLTLSGVDETIGQPIHARHLYQLTDIVENARFADVLSTREDGTRVIDYTRFHDVVPLT